MNDAVKSLATTYAEMIEKLADEHSVTTEKVKLLLGCETLYKNKRGPTLHNAIVHVKALELNEGVFPFSIDNIASALPLQSVQWEQNTH